jgi:hypothetical protein
MATRSHEGETNSWNLSTVISEEKFKGAVYSINTGQNGIYHVFPRYLQVLEFIADGGQLVIER